MKEKCGNRNMHWYQEGNTCVCGQIPYDIFFATSCDCGEGQNLKPVHYPTCSYVAWVEKHNEWAKNHTEVDPPVKLLAIRVKANGQKRQRCLTNVKSVAPMELYEKIAVFGNEKLGHIWKYTADDVLKVMEAIIIYCIELGEKPEETELEDLLLRTLSWEQADGAVKIITHSL